VNIQKVDRRWIFLGVGLMTVIGLQLPIRLPIYPSPQVQDYYNTIQNLPRGSVVLLSADYGASTLPELGPMHQRTIYQVLKNHYRLLFIAMSAEGPNLTSRAMNKVLPELARIGVHPKPDVDYIDLGYKVGGDVVMQGLNTNFRKNCSTDAAGRDIWDNPKIPIMRGIESMRDINLLISMTAGSPGTVEWLSQVQKQSNVTTLSGVTAVMAPELFPFLHSGQLTGLLDGLVGAAAYEKLLHLEGSATAGMTTQSLIHYLLVLLIIVVNIDYLVKRRREGQRT